MQTTNTPLPNSRLQMDFELPAERLSRSMELAARSLSKQHRIPGFRPGKAPRAVVERIVGAPALLDEAVDLLVSDAYREAVREQDLFPITQPEIEVTQAEEGKPLVFKATVQLRPEVKLGDYEHFNFKPEVKTVDDEMVEKTVDELRDGYAKLQTVDGRPAKRDDYAIIGFEGTREGKPFEGGSSERMPLILGQDRLIPGFEEHVIGLEKGQTTEFEIVFPDDYQEESLRGQTAHFKVELKDLREKVPPEANDDFAKLVGKFDNMTELRTELRKRLEENALDSARHEFADKIVDYATANATLELPDILVDQEVEVMEDELAASLLRQGIDIEAYRKVTGKTAEEMRADLRPGAEKRVKTLLVISQIANDKGIEVPDRDIQAEVARARERYAKDRRLLAYYDSERGRNHIRTTLRRSLTIERLIDQWLAAHPEAPRVRHLEDAPEETTVEVPAGAAAAVAKASAGTAATAAGAEQA